MSVTRGGNPSEVVAAVDGVVGEVVVVRASGDVHSDDKPTVFLSFFLSYLCIFFILLKFLAISFSLLLDLFICSFRFLFLFYFFFFYLTCEVVFMFF